MQGLAINQADFDLTALWIFALILVRLIPMFYMLPGVGTEQVPERFRLYVVLVIAFVCTLSLPRVPFPPEIEKVVLALVSEFCIGIALGLLPSLALSGLAVAGQVIAGVIGLGQANMIDRSLGGNVSVLARFNLLLGTLIFLTIDGHHILIKACTLNVGHLLLGQNVALIGATTLLAEAFSSSFRLAIVISSPILIATLISQFLLGLITKFVPQVNIFIISLPLSIFMGFYIIAFTIEPFSQHVIRELSSIEEDAALMLTKD